MWWRPWGHCVARVQKVQKVQRVVVAPMGPLRSPGSEGSEGSKGCGGALRAHYKMAPQALTLPPWSGLYNSPLNQSGRRSRSQAESIVRHEVHER